jgi:hypothetical protein
MLSKKTEVYKINIISLSKTEVYILNMQKNIEINGNFSKEKTVSRK